MLLQRIFCLINFKQNILKRLYSNSSLPDIDTNYYCNINNSKEIKENIGVRKGVGDIYRALDAYNKLQVTPKNHSTYQNIKDELFKELFKLPNKTHPEVKNYSESPHLVKEINKKRDFSENKPLNFSEIGRRLNILRTEGLGNTCGPKSYYLTGPLAELEEALVKYTVKHLIRENFHLVSVPDILPKHILESCGMNLNNDRTQIYSLDPIHHGPDLYLSGTAEMSLAGLLMSTVHCKKNLPLKLAAVSRCYRAETSNLIEERGIYRVHHFTKVEMFVISTPDQSDHMLEYIRETQENIFSPLGVHMKVLDMPPHELGAPAYRKYDIEAWMPGRNQFGEISSCSNCTDYQSRRLHIKFYEDNETKYVHTLNGTACAVPRMLIALVETYQDAKGKINIPEILQPYFSKHINFAKNNLLPEVKLLKNKNAIECLLSFIYFVLRLHGVISFYGLLFSF